MHRSPGINLIAEENSEKNPARRPSMKAMRPVIASSGVPYLHTRSLGSHSTSRRNEENDGLVTPDPSSLGDVLSSIPEVPVSNPTKFRRILLNLSFLYFRK